MFLNGMFYTTSMYGRCLNVWDVKEAAEKRSGRTGAGGLGKPSLCPAGDQVVGRSRASHREESHRGEPRSVASAAERIIPAGPAEGGEAGAAVAASAEVSRANSHNSPSSGESERPTGSAGAGGDRALGGALSPPAPAELVGLSDSPEDGELWLLARETSALAATAAPASPPSAGPAGMTAVQAQLNPGPSIGQEGSHGAAARPSGQPSPSQLTLRRTGRSTAGQHSNVHRLPQPISIRQRGVFEPARPVANGGRFISSVLSVNPVLPDIHSTGCVIVRWSLGSIIVGQKSVTVTGLAVRKSLLRSAAEATDLGSPPWLSSLCEALLLPTTWSPAGHKDGFPRPPAPRGRSVSLLLL
ncbi:uncharacterized protein LOC109140921 [Xyrichtys novacula]|uniref:Uncharacterized protein LOC109140921 n=1 Tax=Xyrichtys novacula TaxID=13765 RepID=A0AAV1EXV2_XYRNO|nr:uncharacterized protein LOC109140921 [Xyrichtys novacula]